MTTTNELSASFKNRRHLRLFLQMVGYVTLLAFLAAVMPEQWIIEASKFLGFDPFPYSPLTFYLARHLSLLYGFVGIGLLIIAADLDQYGRLVRPLALGTIAFGILQLVIDLQSALPHWWTLGESCSTAMGGLIIAWLDRRAAKQMLGTDSPDSDYGD